MSAKALYFLIKFEEKMNIKEIFKDQKVCISDLSTGHIVRLASGSRSKFVDTCEYYYGNNNAENKFFNKQFTVRNFELDCPDKYMELDCSRVVISDTFELAMNDDDIEIKDHKDLECVYNGEFYFVGIFDFYEIYNDCDCYEDGWELEYFKSHLQGNEYIVESRGDIEYDANVMLEVVRVYHIIDGKLHVFFKVIEA